MKLLTTIGSGIGCGVVIGWLYHRYRSPQIQQRLRQKRAQIRNLEESLRNVKISIRQLQKTLPLLKSNDLKIPRRASSPLLHQEWTQLKISLEELSHPDPN